MQPSHSGPREGRAVTHPSPKKIVRLDFPEEKVAVSDLKFEQEGVPAEALSWREEPESGSWPEQECGEASVGIGLSRTDRPSRLQGAGHQAGLLLRHRDRLIVAGGPLLGQALCSMPFTPDL